MVGFGISTLYTAFKLLSKILKQFLKVSTELLKKYIKSQNTWQAAIKQLNPTIVSSEGVSTPFRK